MNEKHYCNTCETFVEDLRRCVESDPFGTGDSWYTETVYKCRTCGSDDIEELAPCDACGVALPLDGFDDCARCVLTDQYSHNKTYDADDYVAARVILRRQDPTALLMIDEDIARTIDRGRP